MDNGYKIPIKKRDIKVLADKGNKIPYRKVK
jgi:hypothetical protein